MKREEQLDILKMDLQLMTDIQDEYLRKLLELSEGEIRREGIKLDDSVESGMVQVHYAAWLFRKACCERERDGDAALPALRTQQKAHEPGHGREEK